MKTLLVRAVLAASLFSTVTVLAPVALAQEAPVVKTFDISPTQGNINVMKTAMPKLPVFTKLPVKKGYVRGYIKDVNGKPLKGAKVGIRSTSAGGFYSGAQAQTDVRGYYELQVPWGVASFYCAGYSIDWGEGRGAFGLYPTDGEAEQFASANGAVKNWVMLPYGIADRDGVSDQPQYAGNYFGGTINVGYWVSDGEYSPKENLPVGSQIEVTLTPTGAMLGGGKAPAFVVRKTVTAYDRSNFYINNLPIATYRFSAVLIQDGKRSPLHLKETGMYSGRPDGLSPKEANGSATLTLRPYGAKADMVTAAHGHWESLAITLSR